MWWVASLPLASAGFSISRTIPTFCRTTKVTIAGWACAPGFCQHSGNQFWSGYSTIQQATLLSRHLVSHGNRLAGNYFFGSASREACLAMFIWNTFTFALRIWSVIVNFGVLCRYLSAVTITCYNWLIHVLTQLLRERGEESSASDWQVEFNHIVLLNSLSPNGLLQTVPP